MTLKLKVGTFLLGAARDVSIPQEFAAWHQTVRVEPGTYDLFAYIDFMDGAYRVRELAVECEGITISSNFRSHVLGTWGKSDNNRNGTPAKVYIRLATYGRCADVSADSLSTTLVDGLLVRREWMPDNGGEMWRFEWNPAAKPVLDAGQPNYLPTKTATVVAMEAV